jgi:hypothetical protein
MNIHDVVQDAAIVLVILNLVVSVAVASSSAYSARQKGAQILVVWAVPIVGGLLMGMFMLSQRGGAPCAGYPSEREEDIGQVWSGLHPPDQKQ